MTCRHWGSILFLGITSGCFSPDRAGERMNSKIELPLRLMTAAEVLREVQAQSGMEYAYPSGSLVRQIDATRFQGRTTVAEAVQSLAPVVELRGGVFVLEADLSDARLRELCDRLASAQAADRRVAAYELGNTRSTRAIAPLMRGLDDADASVRHHALRSLDRLERDYLSYCPAGRTSIFQLSTNALDGLITMIEAAPDASCSEWIWAAGVLGRSGRPDSAKTALAKGLKHGYVRTRDTARWAISRIEGAGSKAACSAPKGAGDHIGAAELVRAFKREKDHEARADLLLKLGRIGGPEAWDLLLAQARARHPVIRRAAIRALNRCPDPRAAEVLMKILVGAEEEPAPTSEKGTPAWASSQTAEYRSLAAMSLGMIGSDQAVALLAKYIKETRKPISSVALALSWTENPLSEGPLLDCLKVKDEDEHGEMNCMLRSFAYAGLARIGTAAALDGITQTYDEYDNTARYAGYSAVRMSGHSQGAVDRGITRLREGKGGISPHVLEEAEDPRAVDALIAAIPEANGKRLHFALQALGRIGDPRGASTLLALLDHAEPWVRYDAFRALRWRWYWHLPDVRDALAKHPVFKAFLVPPPDLAAQPENTWVCRLWPIDMDDDRAANTTYEAGLTFDESTGLVVKSNGHGQRCDSPQLGETWLYDPSANTWRESGAPVVPFGMCGTWGLTYDRANRKVVAMQAEGGHHGWQWERARALRGSTTWIFDGVRDQWTPMQPLHRLDGPGLRAFAPLIYLDQPGLVFLHGGAWGGNSPRELSGRSWTYDTYANAWQMLPESKEGPGNCSHQAMCYLPNVNRVVMGPAQKGGKTWLCDLSTGAWTDARAQGEPPALHLPMVYDPVSQSALAFLAEGHGTAIWQYEPVSNVWKRIDSPVDISPHHDSVDVAYDSKNNVFVMDGGHVNWNTDHIAVREVWTYKFKNRPEKGKPPSLPAPTHRAAPPIPDDVVVSVRADSTVQIRWAQSRLPDVRGYHVYAAAVETGQRFHHKEVFKGQGPVERLTPRPITGCDFADTRKLEPAKGLFNHEIRAYHVKAVNAAGVESGPSATVLTLPGSVGSVTAERLSDGSTRIRWAPAREKEIRGYAVYRMDDFRTPLAVRLNPVPVTGCEYIDWSESPKAERQCYYVVAVDALNEEGIPSTGAWSFGRP